MYCTIEQARAAGATGDDTAVLAAIAQARELIDLYTGDLFEPTELTLVARVQSDGSAILPWQVRQVDSVTLVGSESPVAVSGWRSLSSSIPGQIDAVLLGGLAGGDMLIAGAEPWRGGWSNLLGGSFGTGQVSVHGTFGHLSPPVAVVDACAALAAWRTEGGSTQPPTAPFPPDTDDEGNAVSITVNVDEHVRRTPTTGLTAVDDALVPFIRAAVEFS